MAGGVSDIPEGLLALGVALYSGGRAWALLRRHEHAAVALEAACRQWTRAKTVTPVRTADMTHTLMSMSRWSCTPGPPLPPPAGTLAAAAAEEEEEGASTSADTTAGRNGESTATDVSRHLFCCRGIDMLYRESIFFNTLTERQLTMSRVSSTSANWTPLSSSG